MTQPELEVMGQQLTECEKRADEADRYVDSFLKCVYLRDRIGQTFEAIITSVVDFGCFVQIIEAAADGLLHLDNLRDDEYVKDDVLQAWMGMRTQAAPAARHACARDRDGGEPGGRAHRHRSRRPGELAAVPPAPGTPSMSALTQVYGLHAVRSAAAPTARSRAPPAASTRSATIRACANCCSSAMPPR